MENRVLLALGVVVASAICVACAAPSSPVAAQAHDEPLVVEEVWVETAAVTLYARVAGPADAPTVVVLHGGPGLSHDYTAPLLELAAGGQLRVVIFDQRGVGRSSAAADATAYGLADSLEDLDALRAALGAERIHVLGHSFGGWLAVTYAAAHPDRVASVVVVDGLAPTTAQWLAAQRRFRARLEALQASGVIASLPTSRNDDERCEAATLAVLPVYFADPDHPMTRTLAGTTCHRSVGIATWTAIGWVDLTDVFADVSQPTLVVHGAADPFGVEMAEEIVAALTGTTVESHLLPACGHIPWEECPEAFFEVLSPFYAAQLTVSP